MNTAKSTGRALGIVFLVQIVLAPLAYLWMMRPLAGSDFLQTASSSAVQIRLSLLLTFALGALTIVAAITVLPVFRPRSERMAFAFLAASVVGLSTLAVETIAMHSMLALAEHQADPAVSTDLVYSLAAALRSAAHVTHHMTGLIGHVAVLLLFVLLYRFGLVPRELGAAGMAASCLSTTAAGMALVGYPVVFLAMPALLVDAVLVLWLIARGFEEPDGVLHAQPA